MSGARILRFFLGVIIAAILLVVILPLVGIPSSRFLPPALVYSKAQGMAKGVVTGKYDGASANPFTIGKDDYFINYAFRAPSPPPRGSAVPGPVQDYTGTVRVNHDTYKAFKSPQEMQGSTSPTANKLIPLPHWPVRIKYEKTDPDINGVVNSQWVMHQDGRSITFGSNTMSGWIGYIFLAIFLGYLVSILLASVMKSEEI